MPEPFSLGEKNVPAWAHYKDSFKYTLHPETRTSPADVLFPKGEYQTGSEIKGCVYKRTA